MSSVHENLIAAKALIDTPEKWGKGGWEPKNGRCLCSVGAVVVATNGNHDFDGAWTPAVLQVDAALENHLPKPFNRVAEYNDDPATTHADVMALFDRAIASTAPSGEAP